MSEADAVARVEAPATVDSMARDLAGLGVEAGMVLLVHSSLSALGWVCGGAVAVITALRQALGEAGTLVMPTQSVDLSDPADWESPPIPESWWPAVREQMPPFDPDVTPTRSMGRIPETFRKIPGVVRSRHPTLSFAACGPQTARIVGDHRLEFGLGEGSPLARLYDLDAHVLLLGVDHGANTSLHLAEYRARWPGRRIVRQGSPVLDGRRRRWLVVDNVDLDSDDFARLGEAFAAGADAADLRRGRVAAGEAQLLRQRAAVDFAVGWLPRHRR